MYGTLTLTVSYADRLVMTDFYGRELSETARRAICASLDSIAQVLSTERGIISSTIPLAAQESPGGACSPEKRERIGSDAKGPQQKLLWSESEE